MKKLTIFRLIYILLCTLFKHGNLLVKIYVPYKGFIEPTHVHMSNPIMNINGEDCFIGKFFEISE